MIGNLGPGTRSGLYAIEGGKEAAKNPPKRTMNVDPKDYLDAEMRATRAEVLAEMKASNATVIGEMRALTGQVEGLRVAFDGRLEGMAGQIQGISNRIDGLPTTRAMIWTAVGAVVAALTFGLAILTWGNDQLGVGVSLSPLQAQIEGSSTRLDRIEHLTVENAKQLRAIADQTKPATP